MPYKDINAKRKWQVEWQRHRRMDWLTANGPCARCGTWEDLQVDHKDPKQKVSHRIWSWAEERRKIELAKCQVLCMPCHKVKTHEDRLAAAPHGTDSGYTKRKCRCDACKEAHRTKRKLDRIKYNC